MSKFKVGDKVYIAASVSARENGDKAVITKISGDMVTVRWPDGNTRTFPSFAILNSVSSNAKFSRDDLEEEFAHIDSAIDDGHSPVDIHSALLGCKNDAYRYNMMKDWDELYRKAKRKGMLNSSLPVSTNAIVRNAVASKVSVNDRAEYLRYRNAATKFKKALMDCLAFVKDIQRNLDDSTYVEMGEADRLVREINKGLEWCRGTLQMDESDFDY